MFIHDGKQSGKEKNRGHLMKKMIILFVSFILLLCIAGSTVADTSSKSLSSQALFVSPYQYQLGGNGTSITYKPIGPGAVPILVYKNKIFGTLHFTGKNISTVNVPNLGTLISVTLGTQKIMPGSSHRPLFTILLPQVNLLNKKDASTSIHAIGIRTSYKASSLPPSVHIGQVESYIITDLRGTAFNSNGIIPLDDLSKDIKEQEINSDNKIEEPNQFILNGVGQKNKDVHISYSTNSITGKPVFNYEDSKDTYSLSGDEIRTQKTEIGTLVMVTLKNVPDLHAITLTLLVPSINLDGSAQKFKTIAILTTCKTTIGGESLVKGMVQSYKVIDLQGTANSVMF
jgi:hypothetical protein